MEKDTADRVLAIDRIYAVLEEYGFDRKSLGLTDSFRLAMDSLDLAQLILDLEEEFQIEIPDSDLHLVGCVERAAEYATKPCDSRSH